MLSFLLWYLTITLIGLAAFPLAFRLLPALPDRGYAFSRALGWLLWGYLFWFLGSVGFLRNDLGGQLFALALLLALSGWALRTLDWRALQDWWRAQRRLVLVVEILFLVAFAGMAVVRAANPEIFGTEKPMELGFINSILRSPTFPAHDPWLSGYAISYYHFGYWLVAMLARVTGIPGSVAFNLGIALVFALSALGAYGMVYNLVSLWEGDRRRRTADGRAQTDPGSSGHPLLAGLPGPLFVLLACNLEGLLELLHSSGFLWTPGASSSSFWSWLGVADLTQAPIQPYSWLPRLFGTGSWWWWRASRVVQDYNLAGSSMGDIIDEFPVFSYLLADLHPHVLAMPFLFLVMALALNIYSSCRSGSTNLGFVRIHMDRWTFLLAGVILGGMSFLNTWDILVALALVAGAYALRMANGEIGMANGDEEMADGGQRSVVSGRSFILIIKDFLSLAIPLALLSFLLYIPFYLGFSSQAGGVLPNLLFVTRGAHFWIMFGVFLVPILAFLAYLLQRYGGWKSLGNGLLLAASLALVLFLIDLLLALLIESLPALKGVNPMAETATSLFLGIQGSDNWPAIFLAAFTRRLSAPGAWLTLLIVIGMALAVMQRIEGKGKGIGEEIPAAHGAQVYQVESLASNTPASEREFASQSTTSSRPAILARPPAEESPESEINTSPTPYPLAHNALSINHSPLTTISFTLLLILLGGLITLGPEFLYLRDQFGSRINTIFKFYFQTWMLWGTAAAVGTTILLAELKKGWAVLFNLVLVVLLAMSLTYTVYGLADKTHGFNPPDGWTLDGGAYVARDAPNEMAAIRWLQNAPLGVLVEAVGNDYTDFGRISVFSGDPAVLGWVGHELQWRGGGKEMGSRKDDIQALYTTGDWQTASAILQKYGVRYVILGLRERTTYRVNETKFKRYLAQVFQQGDMTIYQVP